MSDSWTHYDNLKVSPRADPEVIKAAYRALAQKWHPDKHPPERKARCERVMHLINEAYRVLSDPASRARYDESLVPGRSPGAADAPARPARSASRHATPADGPARPASRRAAPPDAPAPEQPACDDDIAGLSHYDLLDLAWDASVEQVDVARAVAVAKWHPCRHPPEQARSCERMQAAIVRAAACLSDPAARRTYNGELMRRNPQAWTRAHERRRPRHAAPASGAVHEDASRDVGPAPVDRAPGPRPRWIARSGDLIAALVDSVRTSLYGSDAGVPRGAGTAPAARRDPGATAT